MTTQNTITIRAEQLAYEHEVKMLRCGLDNFIETAYQTKMDSDWDGICNFVSIVNNAEKQIEETRKKAQAKRAEWVRLQQSK